MEALIQVDLEQLGIEPKLVVCKTTVLTVITITPCLFNLNREGHIWVFSYSHDRPVICLFNYPGSQNRARTCDPSVMVLEVGLEPTRETTLTIDLHNLRSAIPLSPIKVTLTQPNATTN